MTIAGTEGRAAKDTPATIRITLAGQCMIRSDLRATAPEAVPVIQGLLKGDVVFTNFEATVAEKGETVEQGRGFLTPPEALDALGRPRFQPGGFCEQSRIRSESHGNPEHHS